MTEHNKNTNLLPRKDFACRRISSQTSEHFYDVRMNNGGEFELLKINSLYPERVLRVKRTRDPKIAQRWVVDGEGFDPAIWNFDRTREQERRESFARGLQVRFIPDDVSVEGKEIPNGFCLLFLSASRDSYEEVYIMKGDNTEARDALINKFGAEPL